MDVFEVAELFVDLVRRDYPGEVAIVAYYGSYATGTATEGSDLDLYYIPDDGKAASLYRSLLFTGLPFEFWPVSWDFAQRIASGRHHWSVAPSIIMNAQILYSRSDADLERFRGLQRQIKELKKPAARSVALRRAQEAFLPALFQLDKVQHAAQKENSAATRVAAIEVIEAVLDCLALVNQVFFAKNWASDIGQLTILTVRPDALEERVRAIMSSRDVTVVYRQVESLVAETRELLVQQELELSDYISVTSMFNGYYPGIREYVNKVISACEKGDLVAASYAAMILQRDTALMLAGVDTGVTYSALNSYDDYDEAYREAGFPDFTAAIEAEDFATMRRLAYEFDRRARGYLRARSVSLNETDSMEELKKLIDEG